MEGVHVTAQPLEPVSVEEGTGMIAVNGGEVYVTVRLLEPVPGGVTNLPVGDGGEGNTHKVWNCGYNWPRSSEWTWWRRTCEHRLQED